MENVCVLFSVPTGGRSVHEAVAPQTFLHLRLHSAVPKAKGRQEDHRKRSCSAPFPLAKASPRSWAEPSRAQETRGVLWKARGQDASLVAGEHSARFRRGDLEGSLWKESFLLLGPPPWVPSCAIATPRALPCTARVCQLTAPLYVAKQNVSINGDTR